MDINLEILSRKLEAGRKAIETLGLLLATLQLNIEKGNLKTINKKRDQELSELLVGFKTIYENIKDDLFDYELAKGTENEG